MPIMADVNNHPEEVGQILVKVQEDLHQLKHKLLTQAQNGTIDLTALENAINKTEHDLKVRSEQVVGEINQQFSTLPSLEAQLQQREQSYTGPVVESTWDLQRGDEIRRPGSRTLIETSELLRGMDTQPVLTLGRKTPRYQLTGATPGQKLKQVWSMRVAQNPHNPQNRTVMQDNFGVQLPQLEDRKSATPSSAKIVKGNTVEHLTVLPKANRVDPQLIPPAISEDDAKHGILSLIERGLIPPAAELTLDPSPVHHRMAPLHDPMEKSGEKAKPSPMSDGSFNLASIKLDTNFKATESTVSSVVRGIRPSPPTHGKHRKGAEQPSKTPVMAKKFEMPLQPMPERPATNAVIMELLEQTAVTPIGQVPPPTTPASGDFKASNYRFAMQHGKVRDTAPDFLAFKQHYCLSWGAIVSMFKHLERMLTEYAVPVAFIHGDRLADLSLEYELDSQPTLDDLLSVIINKEDVESILKRPGRRYLGPDGEFAAATKIQATWKRFRDRRKYLEYRRLKWASGVIAITWVMNVKMSQVRKQLKRTRIAELEGFRKRAKLLSTQWNRMKHSKRVIIHVPSLGYNQPIRDSIKDFGIRQNAQMGRLCDLKDPNVDVIYISPVPVNDETVQYYTKLLGLKSAIDSGDVDKQGDMTDRYKIIVPEAIKSFPTHRMCLATHLKYSPRALRRIKNLIRGRDAYIVPGMPHKDDLSVAHILNIPLLCTEPEIAHLYTSKSGAKRIFQSANVAIPPSEFDVYSLPQLHESLAQLVTDNLEVKTWVLKIDDEFDGRGIAYCNVTTYLESHQWALKEAKRYGDKWSKKWAQEQVFMKIQSEIPDILEHWCFPVDSKVYPTWPAFLDAFLAKGGIIEARPPAEDITALTADMLLEPNGKISIVSLGDQIHAETPYKCWGLSVPQSSVEPAQLNDACMRIAEACKARGVVGYFTIDFVTFIDPKTDDQVLWAVDLSLSYSDSTTMNNLLQFVAGGKLDINTHIYNIPPPKKEPKKRRPKGREEEEVPPNTNRFAVMSTQLVHSNLAVVHYSVFFQMCRAHGIGFDIKEKQGSIFTLIDSFNRENLGMITVGDNLQGTLGAFARNLSVIHQEISAPNMQGESNFKAVIQDIESILGTTVLNADEQTRHEDQEDSSSQQGTHSQTQS
ncbi:IQ domain-containing protein H isoform X2 [Lingula anatina]|uniref:IQ domain-containing protein H isoform X2 n=1 Tax=Lingula anatina TaxID=7574 RepID=A0A1S3I7P2_LINAN|nr:IQ domain-containing protein H isoform X2 [Lingula anatina]|eukprot:XP_013393394.1 IQ domain-containing protein H isoform X2 [Lingula anatina]